VARVSTYLNFPGTTEAAFAFYRSVFGTEYVGPILRFGDLPETAEGLDDDHRGLVLHIELPILGGHLIMGTDHVAAAGHEMVAGTNVSLNLEPDTIEEGRTLFARLSEGATDAAPLQPMPWGAWWTSFVDRFGLRWMINVPAGASGSPDAGSL